MIIRKNEAKQCQQNIITRLSREKNKKFVLETKVNIVHVMFLNHLILGAYLVAKMGIFDVTSNTRTQFFSTLLKVFM